MAVRATIREKGQLTVPVEIRRLASLHEGSVVEFELVAEGVLLRPRMIVDEDTAIDAVFARDVIAQTVAGYAALRADEDAWRAEIREREELAGSLADGLDT